MGDLGGTANVTLSDNASFTVPNAMPRSGSTGGKGHITLNDSATFTSAKYVYVGVADAAEASITLNGGTFTAPYFFTTGPGVINFNGGALKASAASDDFIQGATFAVNVEAGGAKIDTGGVDITVTSVFHNISATTPGGLTKLGDGVLTLTASLTDIGDTTVNQGTLIASAGINTPSDMVYVATGADLNRALHRGRYADHRRRRSWPPPPFPNPARWRFWPWLSWAGLEWRGVKEDSNQIDRKQFRIDPRWGEWFFRKEGHSPRLFYIKFVT